MVPSSFDSIPQIDPPWVRSTRALIRRNPEEALYWAKHHTDEDLGIGHEIFFFSHVLIRAELASGNGRAARYLLHQLADRGTVTYFDDFYLARAELLLGHRDRAAAALTRLRESVMSLRSTGEV